MCRVFTIFISACRVLKGIGRQGKPIELQQNRMALGLSLLLALASGCETNSSLQPVPQGRGIYTTLLTQDMLAHLSTEDDSAVYPRQTTFGGTEIPVAVVTGCGSLTVTLELVDYAKKKSFPRAYHIGSEQSLIWLPPIGQGHYKIRLLVRGQPQASFNFFVKRDFIRTSSGRIDYDTVIRDTTAILQLNTNDVGSYILRASAHVSYGELEAAIGDLGQAIRIQPYNSATFAQRAQLYVKNNDWDNAIVDWDEVVRLNPENPAAVYDRAIAYKKHGDFAKAVGDLRRAVQLDPNSPKPKNELAWLLAVCPDANLRNGKEAVELATLSCESVKWRSGKYLDTIAAACAETGDFESAMQYQKKALDCQETVGRRRAVFQERLLLYEGHKAYHLPQE